MTILVGIFLVFAGVCIGFAISAFADLQKQHRQMKIKIDPDKLKLWISRAERPDTNTSMNI